LRAWIAVKACYKNLRARKDNTMLRKLLILVAVSAVVLTTVGTAVSVTYLHMVPPGIDKNGNIPPDGASWHELYPFFCRYFTQIRYIDNGDGIISVCDYITLQGPDGATYRHHIEDVLWAYVFHDALTIFTFYFETYHGPNGDPSGSYFHLVYEDEDEGGFCEEWFVDSWEDLNKNGIVDAGDVLYMADPWGGYPHGQIVEVSIDILIDDGTAVGDGTWGAIKAFFGGMF
jgi:hypothetical protein